MRLSEREEQRKDEDHHDAHEDLKRQTDLDIVHEGVLACRHHKGIRGVENGEAKHTPHSGI